MCAAGSATLGSDCVVVTLHRFLTRDVLVTWESLVHQVSAKSWKRLHHHAFVLHLWNTVELKSGNPTGNISVSFRVIEPFIFEHFITKARLLLSFPAASSLIRDKRE